MKVFSTILLIRKALTNSLFYWLWYFVGITVCIICIWRFNDTIYVHLAFWCGLATAFLSMIFVKQSLNNKQDEENS